MKKQIKKLIEKYTSINADIEASGTTQQICTESFADRDLGKLTALKEVVEDLQNVLAEQELIDNLKRSDKVPSVVKENLTTAEYMKRIRES